MEKKLILFFILSIVIIISSTLLMNRAPAPPPQEEVTATPESAPSSSEDATYLKVVQPTSEIKSEQIEIEIGNNRIVFDSQGAKIIHWYHQIKENTEPVDLIFPDEKNFFLQLRLNNNLLDNYLYNYEEGENFVNFTLEHQDFKICKKFIFSEQDNLHQIEISLINLKDSPLIINDFSLLLGPGLGMAEEVGKESLKNMHAIGLINGEVKKKLKPGTYENVGWLGINNRYLLACFLNQENLTGFVEEYKKNVPLTGLKSSQIEIPAHQQQIFKIGFFACPKYYSQLASYNKGFEQAVNFNFIAKGFYYVLSAFYKVMGNYGWAIIALTIILFLILYPLNIRNAKMSKKMKDVNPQIKAIQQKFKDDPKRMQVEMMNIYKKNKISPLSGCLPLLVQLPLWWGILAVLRDSMELWKSPFIFWIKDLSAADPFYILPILMAISMYISQKRMASDPTSSKMAIIMPIIFFFLFMRFPAGLVLYWLCYNILGIIQQQLILSK